MRAQPALRPAPSILLLTVWFGLVGGLLELGIMRIQYLGGERFGNVTSQNPHAVWLSPLSYTLLLLIPAALVIAAAALGWRRSSRAPIPLFVFLITASLLFLYHPQIHAIAIVILAAGVAALADRHPGAMHTLARRSIVPLVLGGAVLALGVLGGRWMEERRERAGLPGAPGGAPNVLLIVLDTVRAASLSLYGYPRETTPFLERLAERGVVFNNAYATSSWTLPSHASLFTGHYPDDLSADWAVSLNAARPTLAEQLGARGYVTGGFVANRGYVGPRTGLNRGFQHFDADLISAAEILHSSSLGRQLQYRVLTPYVSGLDLSGRKTARGVRTEFLDWLDSVEARPFFAFLNYYEAHEPSYAPPPFDHRFAKVPLPTGPRPRVSGSEEAEAYDGAIAYLDYELDLLFDELERRGVLEDTVVILTSDHGQAFGEHGLNGHGRHLYRQVVHVPLLIIFPARVPPGRRVDEVATIRDVPNTIWDLAGLGVSAFPGRSLARRWGSATAPPDTLYTALGSHLGFPRTWPIAKGPMRAVVAGRHHYIRNGDGREELYDVVDDPWEQRDLAMTAEGIRQRRALRAALARLEAGS